MFTLLALFACNPEAPPVDTTPPVVEPPPEPPAVVTDPLGTFQVHPPVGPDEAPDRDWRRMDIDQLRASLARVSGGIQWNLSTTDVPDLDEFQRLSATLGKPDYVQSTQENLEPTLLFQKFLDDAAVHVCTQLVATDSAKPQNERVFFVHAERNADPFDDADAIEANVQYLVLRYHGRSVPLGDARLEPWTFLYESTHQVTHDSGAAWRAVCVGLITHPDFYTY